LKRNAKKWLSLCGQEKPDSHDGERGPLQHEHMKREKQAPKELIVHYIRIERCNGQEGKGRVTKDQLQKSDRKQSGINKREKRKIEIWIPSKPNVH